MLENKKSILIWLIVGLVCIITVTGSYAFLSVGNKQELANTFKSGCLNISLENESNSLNLNNALPITDVEGLKLESYKFSIKNSCETPTKFQINIENLNQMDNSLSADYVKVSLSNDTMDNVVSILSTNPMVEPTVNNAYEAFNIYVGEIAGNETKEFALREWLDYETNTAQGANKVYSSKINVIASSEIQHTSVPEIKTRYENKVLSGDIVGDVSTIKYCISYANICTPNMDIIPTENKINLDLNVRTDQIVCIQLNDGDVTCSDTLKRPDVLTIPDIVLGYQENNKTSSIRNGVITVDTEKDSDKLYITEDNDGNSYFYAGINPNNYVKFGKYSDDAPTVYYGYFDEDPTVFNNNSNNYKEYTSLEACQTAKNFNNNCTEVIRAGKDMYWRIIRVNGDGTLRMIYNGVDLNHNGEYLNISNREYSGTQNDTKYVGFMYTTGEPHGNKTTSEILGGVNSTGTKSLNGWYNVNLKEKYSEYLDLNVGFCNDRSRSEGTGINQEPTKYMPLARIWSKTPSLKCAESSDMFKVPVGLITVDEVVFAGGTYGSTRVDEHWLFSKNTYWTMSPSQYSEKLSAHVFVVNRTGKIVDPLAANVYGVRPVINLKADTHFKLGGEGTKAKPYEVLMNR